MPLLITALAAIMLAGVGSFDKAIRVLPHSLNVLVE